MTLGIFMPLLTLALAPIGALLLGAQLRRLPDTTAPDYDPEKVPAQARVLRFAIAWQFVAPVLFYLIFNVIAPDLGTMVLF